MYNRFISTGYGPLTLIGSTRSDRTRGNLQIREMETGKIAIDHLDDNNYTTWSTRLVFLLKTRKLQQALLPDFDAARNVDVDMQAQAIIGLHVKEHLLSIIKDAKTARDAWEQLAKLFKDKSKAKISQLRRELNSLKMESGETVTQYIAELRI